MVSKVTRSPGADSSGIYRRPKLVLKVQRFEDIPIVLGKTKSYPTPVRMGSLRRRRRWNHRGHRGAR